MNAGGRAEPYLRIPSEESKITSAIWGPLDETIITGHANGCLMQWDAKTGEMKRKIRPHRDVVSVGGDRSFHSPNPHVAVCTALASVVLRPFAHVAVRLWFDPVCVCTCLLTRHCVLHRRASRLPTSNCLQIGRTLSLRPRITLACCLTFTT